MALTPLISVLIAGIGGIVAISTTASPLLGVIVFAALFLLLSGGSLAFISTLNLPSYVWILILFLIIYLISKKK